MPGVCYNQNPRHTVEQRGSGALGFLAGSLTSAEAVLILSAAPLTSFPAFQQWRMSSATGGGGDHPPLITATGGRGATRRGRVASNCSVDWIGLRRPHDLVVEAIDLWLDAAIPAVPLDIVRVVELLLRWLQFAAVNDRPMRRLRRGDATGDNAGEQHCGNNGFEGPPSMWHLQLFSHLRWSDWTQPAARPL
jgi:hypothetical protein